MGVFLVAGTAPRLRGNQRPPMADMSPHYDNVMFFFIQALPCPDFKNFSLCNAAFLDLWNSRWTTLHGLNFMVHPFFASALCDLKRANNEVVNPIYFLLNFSEYNI